MALIGITGHQRLDKLERWTWVANTMRDELTKLEPPLIAVTSLAVGADQLFAELILEGGGSIHAVLPFADIERSFSAGGLSSFRKLLKGATVEVLNTFGTDEDAYLAAGKRVVDLSDIMFAVWNGKPAVGKGGTADIVAYARSQGVPLIHLNPISRKTILTTPPDGS
jgi:hypothetical protein